MRLGFLSLRTDRVNSMVSREDTAHRKHSIISDKLEEKQERTLCISWGRTNRTAVRESIHFTMHTCSTAHSSEPEIGRR